MDREPKHELPERVESILSSLHSLYKKEGNALLEKTIVNVKEFKVIEESEYDNWDGGTYGHDLHLRVPKAILDEIIDEKVTIEKKLREDIAELVNIRNEYFSIIQIELAEGLNDGNWRVDSGLLVDYTPSGFSLSEDDLREIWEPGYFRLFLSHKAEYKKEAALLKKALLYYGISSFVAHEDIEPTREWQKEIEKALFSMDAMAALMTDGFHNSNWTDQEIGAAFGRGVPIVSVDLGLTPYGFIGKYQAVPGKGKSAEVLARNIYDLLFENQKIRNRVVEALVTRFENPKGYVHANELMPLLEGIQNAPLSIIERLEKVPENNRDVGRAFSVQNRLPVLIAKLKEQKDKPKY